MSSPGRLRGSEPVASTTWLPSIHGVADLDLGGRDQPPLAVDDVDCRLAELPGRPFQSRVTTLSL